MLDSRKCMEIYNYCQEQYKRLMKKEGVYNIKHDRIVASLAAKQFKMSEETINKAYDLAAHVFVKSEIKRKHIGALYTTT